MAALSELATRVAEIRLARGLTQQELAKLCGLSRSSIANIEAGRQDPTSKTLVQLGQALGVSVGVLVGAEPIPDMPQVPVVQVVRRYLVVCELCGQVEGASDYATADRVRRLHKVPHQY